MKKCHLGFFLSACIALYSSSPHPLYGALATTVELEQMELYQRNSEELADQTLLPTEENLKQSPTEPAGVSADILGDPLEAGSSTDLASASSSAPAEPSSQNSMAPEPETSSLATSDDSSSSPHKSHLWQDILLAITAAGVATVAILLVSWSNHPSSHPYNPTPSS